jgi:hypothetical protein
MLYGYAVNSLCGEYRMIRQANIPPIRVVCSQMCSVASKKNSTVQPGQRRHRDPMMFMLHGNNFS